MIYGLTDEQLKNIIHKHNVATKTNTLLFETIKSDIETGKLLIFSDWSLVPWPSNWIRLRRFK
jgi:hypothetical protein